MLSRTGAQLTLRLVGHTAGMVKFAIGARLAIVHRGPLFMRVELARPAPDARLYPPARLHWIVCPGRARNAEECLEIIPGIAPVHVVCNQNVRIPVGDVENGTFVRRHEAFIGCFRIVWTRSAVFKVAAASVRIERGPWAREALFFIYRTHTAAEFPSGAVDTFPDGIQGTAPRPAGTEHACVGYMVSVFHKLSGLTCNTRVQRRCS